MKVKNNKAVIGLVITFSAFVMLMINIFAVTQNGIGNGGSAIWNHEFQNVTDEIVENCDTDAEKVDAIYNWITTNIKYDNDYKFGLYQKTNVNKVIETKTGVCYDYSNVFAAMCRSQNIPCQIIDGVSKTSNMHHSWNKVFLDGKWYEVDVTNDASYIQNNEGEYFGYQPENSSESIYKITKTY